MEELFSALALFQREWSSRRIFRRGPVSVGPDMLGDTAYLCKYGMPVIVQLT